MCKHWAILALACGLAVPGVLAASDHADPVTFDTALVREPNITGLFVFPDGDRLVVVLNVYRALSVPPPYKLQDYELEVLIDLHSRVSFASEQMRSRYGGEVVDPSGIRPDVTITVQLANDATLASKTVTGLQRPEEIRWYAGVRDDPFIFPRFFNRNVVSTVMSIPASSFPAGQQDFVFWAVTRRKSDGEQIDHVGRSARTQLPRFGFLNHLPPSEHVAEIQERQARGAGIGRFLMRRVAPATDLYAYTLALRHYDAQPDVMIYTTRFEPGYPNGRRLPDDIVGMSCAQGDCILQELALIDSETWPRQTVNDKEFLSEFPYLAEPWPERPPMPMESYLSNAALLALAGLGLALLLALLWWWCLQRGRV